MVLPDAGVETPPYLVIRSDLRSFALDLSLKSPDPFVSRACAHVYRWIFWMNCGLCSCYECVYVEIDGVWRYALRVSHSAASERMRTKLQKTDVWFSGNNKIKQSPLQLSVGFSSLLILHQISVLIIITRRRRLHKIINAAAASLGKTPDICVKLFIRFDFHPPPPPDDLRWRFCVQ